MNISFKKSCCSPVWNLTLLETFEGFWVFQAQITRQNIGSDTTLTIKKLHINTLPYI